MHLTDLALARIVQAANRLQQTRRLKANVTTGYYDRQAALDDNTLFEEITPVTTLLITRREAGIRPLPEIWCPDVAWAREYLENAKDPAFLQVWELSREEPAPKDITLDFCEQWMQDAGRWDDDADGFLGGLPEFVRENYGSEALDQYRRKRGSK